MAPVYSRNNLLLHWLVLEWRHDIGYGKMFLSEIFGFCFPIFLQRGGRGIRTPGTREGPLVFKTSAFVRYAIPPRLRLSVN